jgi:divalent metal cation (Fe/Co/Zn/Cd) transporter
MILARESRSLLLGEGIAPQTRQQIKALAEKDPAVISVINIMSTYQSPEEIVLMLTIAFKPDLDTQDITDAIERVRESIKKKYSLVRFVIIQPQEYGM